MFIPRVYIPQPFTAGQTLALDKEDSHYLSTVLRLKTLSPLVVFNGQGGEYTAIFHLNQKKANIEIEAYREGQLVPSLELHLGQSLLRADRMDWVIEKATELGVTHITPLISKNCAVKIVSERLDKRLQHWQKIVISASEQCGRTTLPQMNPPILVSEFIKQPFAGTSILFEMGGQSIKQLPITSAFRLAIGPESGWSGDEIKSLQQANFVQSFLGPRILRAETAGVVSLSLLQGFFGDMC